MFQNSGQTKPDKVVINPETAQVGSLRKAAISAVPFCEECFQKKTGSTSGQDRTTRSDEVPPAGKHSTTEDKKPKIVRIYWVDENNGIRTIDEIPANKNITLCIETQNVADGEKIDIQISDNRGRRYKDGSVTLSFQGIVDADGTAYIDDVKLLYE